MKANPQFVVRGSDGKLYIDKNIKEHNKNPDSEGNPVNEPVTGESQIRMLTGVSDNYDSTTDTYSDGTSYFYIKGKKPNGESINVKFSLKNSDSVNDLLKKIGKIYGNTATSKVVDVSLNDMGEIQIKDIQSGKMITDFYMVASDKDEASIEDLVKNGDYIVEFQKSNYASVPMLSSATASNKYFDNRIYKFGVVFKKISNHENAIPQDIIQSVLGNVNLSISINSTSYSVTSTQTFQDLLDKINNAGYKAYMSNGEIIIEDTSAKSSNDDSNLDINMKTTDTNGNEVIALTPKDVVNFDKLFMEKNGNIINSNVSQIVKDYKIIFKDEQKILQKNPLSQTYATEDTVIADTMGTDDMPQEIKLKFRDKNGELKTATITLKDKEESGHLSTFTFNGHTYDIYEPNGEKTPAHDTITTITEFNHDECKACKKENLNKGMTYRQLADVVSMLIIDNLPATNSAEDYNKAVNEAKKEVTVGMDDKGRFYLKDNSNNSTKIDLSMYTENNSLYFQANNAVTIDEPQVDFFETLQKAIDAVKNGNFYPDSEKNPRSFGIEGAIEAIDHLTDHIRRNHAKIGAVSNEFKLTIERVDMLKLNVQQLQSDNIDTDIGEATMKLNSLNTSYQALLASIAKINKISLLNYL
jgi:flagellar hook-associated protein 3 FlgL